MRVWRAVAAIVAVVGLSMLSFSPSLRAQALLATPNLDVLDNGTITAAVSQPDGGIIVAGNFVRFGGLPRAGLARIAPDGSVDPSWNPVPYGHVDVLAVDGSGAVYAASWSQDYYHLVTKFDGGGAGSTVWSVQANSPVQSIATDGGDVVVGGVFTQVAGLERGGLAKLSAQDGAVDPLWAPRFTNVGTLAVYGQAVYAGGIFEIVQGRPRRGLVRISRSGIGELDADWAPIVAADTAPGVLLADGAGKLYVATAGDTPALVRISLATGQVDGWGANPGGSISSLALGGGFVHVGGAFSWIDGQMHVGIARYSLADGAIDAAWPAAFEAVRALAVSPDGSRVVLGGAGRIGQLRRNGLAVLDATGAPAAMIPAMASGAVSAIARMGDGGLLIGGTFSMIGAHERFNLARLNPDHTLDTGWRADTDGEVRRLAANAAGEIYLGGAFSTVAGQVRRSIAKLSADGSLDALWNPSVTKLGSQATVDAFAFGEGSVYVGGRFDEVDGVARSSLAKLDGSDSGAVDPAWNPNPVSAAIDALLFDEGRLYVAGSYQGIGGYDIQGLSRVDAEGSGQVDVDWNPRARNPVTGLARRGRALFAQGGFVIFDGSIQHGTAKLLVDGTGAVDALWSSGPTESELALDGAGSLYVFATVANDEGPHFPRVWKIFRDGQVDRNWRSGIGDEGSAKAILLDNGRIYLGGDIVRAGNEQRLGLAAFENDVIFGDGVEP